MAKKLLQGIQIPDEADRIKEALDKKADNFPSLTTKNNKTVSSPRKVERVSKHINVPVYVWEQVRKLAFEDNVPVNVLVMKALQGYGVKIENEDLIDARTVR